MKNILGKAMQQGTLPLYIGMRKPRKLLKNAKYHVVSRANRREMILNSHVLKCLFLDIVKKARAKYAFLIDNFCIMGNHFHFIIQPLQDENLSRIMQWILSLYAMNYNRIFNLKGHVWHDRFKSKIINDFRQYVTTFIYIMKNPVYAKIVKKPGDYKFNGINFIRKGWYEIINPPDMFIILAIPSISQMLIK